MRKTLTANGTGVLLITGRDINNVQIFWSNSPDFGGGTLAFSMRDRDSGDSLYPLDSVTTSGDGQYPVGGDVEVHYTLSGATAPSIDLMITQGR